MASGSMGSAAAGSETPAAWTHPPTVSLKHVMVLDTRGRKRSLEVSRTARRASAMDPDVHVLSYNVGLTNAQVDPQLSGMSPYFFKFTKELRNVIQRMFTRGADTPALDARSAGADTPSTPAHAVFLCELGSQKRDEKIDAVFQKRVDAGLPLATKYTKLGFCNSSCNLAAYLCHLVRTAGLDPERYAVWANAPYAAIYDNSRFRHVHTYDLFQTQPPSDRRAAIMKFRMKATQRDLVVVCNHSPKSKNGTK